MFDEKSGLNARWMSRKGSSTSENRDACGIYSCPRVTFALIVDATDQGMAGGDLAGDFIRHAVNSTAKKENLGVNDIVDILREVHRALRLRYLTEKACYSGLLIRHDLAAAWTITCGDCRVGQCLQDGKVNWITPVHCVATMLGEDFTAEHAHLSQRHTVTRRLHAKRFDEPEIRAVEVFSAETHWILATDGHWIESISPRSKHNNGDDASWLSISSTHAQDSYETDCDNWYRFEHKCAPYAQ